MTNRTGRRRLPAFAAGLATAAMALGFTALPAGAAPPVPDVDLVAVGDSYTAGVGAGSFIAPFPCLQTNGGYVDVLKALPIVDDVVSNEACAGALLVDGPSDVIPSVMEQIAALSASEGLSGRTELVTITAGANDLDFTTPLAICATSTLFDCAQAVQAAQTQFPVIQANLVDALTAIHKAAPRATIVVFGYPLLFNPEGGPALLTPEAQMLVNTGTAALNEVISDAVDIANAEAKANAVYVDVTDEFADHAINSLTGASWINFNPQVPFAPENFHPNAAGHNAYADALVDEVNLQAIARR
ncbi:SGNH/GDSL hydrolase family protein [Arthrobacter sp. CDRTa11]|uniref:SGNH/GDSL hydrolase family protein n=1 Tax=Arthrobacter sp. CDRTa11 TaxID=2651199 RepID=UPI00226591A9|nr:SGNH/GDSL hydrolase family protein [Arthrobacter sp. CDRTa11]UZX04400.1 SGNH/GDSL hydrolase family protein [Arthrobacter sp. CDRTa11]